MYVSKRRIPTQEKVKIKHSLGRIIQKIGWVLMCMLTIPLLAYMYIGNTGFIIGLICGIFSLYFINKKQN
jgi:hypothetical protein